MAIERISCSRITLKKMCKKEKEKEGNGRGFKQPVVNLCLVQLDSVTKAALAKGLNFTIATSKILVSVE